MEQTEREYVDDSSHLRKNHRAQLTTCPIVSVIGTVAVAFFKQS